MQNFCLLASKSREETEGGKDEWALEIQKLTVFVKNLSHWRSRIENLYCSLEEGMHFSMYKKMHIHLFNENLLKDLNNIYILF